MTDRPETDAVTAGRDDSRSLSPAMWPSTVWSSNGLDATKASATALRSDEFYGRYANPTVGQFERAVAHLEGAESAVAFGSGMGALASVVLTFCGTGSHVVAQDSLYGGTYSFLDGPCRRFGIDVTFVDAKTPGAFASAVIPGKTMLVIAETPSNPLLDIIDLDELGAITGPFILVDSTLGTPLGQRPLQHGVDLVMHSATKGIGGHNDAMIGILAGERPHRCGVAIQRATRCKRVAIRRSQRTARHQDTRRTYGSSVVYCPVAGRVVVEAPCSVGRALPHARDPSPV